MNAWKNHVKYLLLGVLGTSLVFSAPSLAKNGTEKAAIRFANIKLIVNDQVIKTKAEPFIYNGNVYAPVATIANALGIEQQWDNQTPAVRVSGTRLVPKNLFEQAAKDLPVPYDFTDPKVRFPRVDLLTKSFINFTGESSQEFIVCYTETAPEGIPYRAWASVFRYEKGKLTKLGTAEMYNGESAMQYDPAYPPGNVFYDADSNRIVVLREAFKLITTPTTSSFGKGELLEAKTFEWKNGQLTKTNELVKP